MNHVPPASFVAHIRKHGETCPVVRALVHLRRIGSNALSREQRSPMPKNADPHDPATAMPTSDTHPSPLHPL